MCKVAIAATAGNMGDLSIALEIAKDIKRSDDCFAVDFYSYGIRYSHMIAPAGFKAKYPPPFRVSPFAPNIEKLIRLVEYEAKNWQVTQSDVIINKHEMSPVFSARLAGIPLVWVVNYPWTKTCFETGRLGSNPMDLLYGPDSNRSEAEYLEPFQKVARHFGLPEAESFHDLFTGEMTWVLDIPELTATTLPEGQHYIGPIFGRINGDIPAELANLDPNRPIIFFSMGSSTHRDKLLEILRSFRLRPDYQVIAPIKWRLGSNQFDIPDNVITTDLLPAHLVNPMADVAVIHGGSGTLSTACISGTPFIGFGNFLEQKVNIDLVAEQGAALRMSMQDVNPEEIVTAVDRLLHDPDMRQAASRLQADFQAWQSKQRPVNLLKQLLGRPQSLARELLPPVRLRSGQA